MNARDDDRSALARIEAHLAASDPDFDVRVRLASALLARRRAWHVATVAGEALLALAAGILLVLIPDHTMSEAVVAGLVVAAAVVWTPIVYRAARRQPAEARHSRIGHALRSLVELSRPVPNQDELLIDPRDAVVVGCDGSPVSDAALRFAAAEARRRQLALLVVIAFAEPIDPDNDEFDTPRPVQRDRARAKAQSALARAVSDPPRHQVVAVAGMPGRVLAEQFSKAALIVIGARHKHLLAPLTTADSTEHLLVAHGRAPVVVVPPAWSP